RYGGSGRGRWRWRRDGSVAMGFVMGMVAVVEMVIDGLLFGRALRWCLEGCVEVRLGGLPCCGCELWWRFGGGGQLRWEVGDGGELRWGVGGGEELRWRVGGGVYFSSLSFLDFAARTAEEYWMD
nr:hypothetical protein [Tanacetum cinerariifolium]